MNGESALELRRTNLVGSFKGDADLSNSSHQQLAFLQVTLPLLNLQNVWEETSLTYFIQSLLGHQKLFEDYVNDFNKELNRFIKQRKVNV